MNESEMIIKLESAIRKMRKEGINTESIERFFNVGEWLIALEGVENILSNNRINDDLVNEYIELKNYFN